MRATSPETVHDLLELDLGAGGFELLLDVLGFGLVGAFLDGLGSAFDQRLGFAEAQTGDGADFLDDVDLVLADSEDDVEFSLFFSTGSSSSQRRQQQQRRPEQQRKRPTSLRAASTVRKPRERSGRKVVYDFGEISHLISSFCSVRTVVGLTARNRLMRASSFSA